MPSVKKKVKDKFYIGVDVGGTTIKFGVFDSTKKMIDEFSIVTQFRETSAEKLIVKDMLDTISDYLKTNVKGVTNKNLVGIGFAIPGPVVKNKIIRAVNINWKKNYDIVKATKARFGKNIKVSVLNDANAAALAEYKITLKEKYKSICLLTLGTAVGTGVIIEGKLIEGSSGVAGELSHVRVDFSKDALKCKCGNVGCLETVTGGKGIANIYNRMYHTKVMKGAAEVIHLAKAGDKKALAALEKSLDYLSMIISVIMLVYEPEVVLIGGGVSNEGTFITDIITKCLKPKVYITNRFPKILIAKLKNKAGMYGVISNL